MSEVSSLAEAKAHLSELVARVGDQHERITVTVHGRPVAVLLAVDDLESLEETIAVLSDATALRALGEADAELARGDGRTRTALPGHASTPSQDVTDRRYELIIAPTAKKELAEQLPESVAFAVYEFIIGPLLDNPHRVGKQTGPAVTRSPSSTPRHLPRHLQNRRRASASRCRRRVQPCEACTAPIDVRPADRSGGRGQQVAQAEFAHQLRQADA